MITQTIYMASKELSKVSCNAVSCIRLSTSNNLSLQIREKIERKKKVS